MRRVGAIALAATALLASIAVGPAVESKPDGMAAVPAGLYMPFLRVKALNASNADATAARRVDAFALDAEPVTNAQFLDFVDGASPMAQVSDQGAVRRRPLSPALAVRSRTGGRGGARRAGHQRLVVRRRSLLQGARAAPADDGAMGICARRRRTRSGSGAIALAGMVLASQRRPPGFGRRGAAQRLRPQRHGRPRLGMDPRLRRLRADGGIARFRRQGQRNFCGGAAAGVSDATDYPAFMRFSMRASLKADYTADNLGFRCAGGAQ